jgi:hypothetical protein
MHVPRMLVVAVIVAASAFGPSGSRAQASLQIPPSQLVSEVVYNELHVTSATATGDTSQKSIRRREHALKTKSRLRTGQCRGWS